MLGGSRSPSVASGLDNVGSEKFQSPEREGRLESSAPEGTLCNGGAAANADIGTVVPIPPKVLQLKLVKDIAPQTTTLKRAGEPANADVGIAALIPPKVPQLKLVKDTTPQTATPKLASCTTNTDDGAPIPPKVPRVKLVKDITLQVVTSKLAGAAANADDGTALPIPPKVMDTTSQTIASKSALPRLKLVMDITSQTIASKSASAAANSDYGTAVPTPLKMRQLRLVKGITLHTATPKPAITAEKAVQQTKRKANNDIGESPAARLKLNIDDVPLGLSAKSSESSTLCCFSKAVLMDNLRSLTKLDLDDEESVMSPSSSENTPHFLSRAELMDNLRTLANDHNLSDVSINDSNQKSSKGKEHGQ